MYNVYYNNNERRSEMNLEEFKAHIIATRQASKAEALSVLSATITNSTTKKEGATNGN
jgi:hypothetical protein